MERLTEKYLTQIDDLFGTYRRWGVFWMTARPAGPRGRGGAARCGGPAGGVALRRGSVLDEHQVAEVVARYLR